MVRHLLSLCAFSSVPNTDKASLTLKLHQNTFEIDGVVDVLCERVIYGPVAATQGVLVFLYEFLSAGRVVQNLQEGQSYRCAL